jgi:hypothetical protein
MEQVQKLIDDMKEEIARNNHANFFLLQRAIKMLEKTKVLCKAAHDDLHSSSSFSDSRGLYDALTDMNKEN